MEKILRSPAVEQATGFCAERIRQLEKAGLFPKRFKLTPDSGQNGAIGWLASEVDGWIRERAATRDVEPATRDEAAAARGERPATRDGARME